MKKFKVKFPDRIEYYNEKGERHRTDGPTIEWDNGDKLWYINGKIHRTDGPACEYPNGTKSWYLNDIRYSEDQYQQEIIKIKLKRILDL